MTLRTRVGLIAAVAVAIAVLAASVGLYLATARTLHDTVDTALIELAQRELPRLVQPDYQGGIRIGMLGGAGAAVQVVTSRGAALVPPGDAGFVPLPVDERAVEVAAGERRAFFETVTVRDVPVRILTVPGSGGLAFQLARPLTEVENTLERLRGQLVLAALGGISVAALLGTLVARRAMRPVRALTDMAEQITATQDLSRRLALHHDRDEIGRLAAAFDEMLGQLEQARRAQEQLVADASHELRTPLTSLRTNIELLADPDALPAGERRQLIDDVVTQIDEFSRLISGLVELARGAQPASTPVEVRVDELARHVATRLDPAGSRVVLDTVPVTLTGDADRVEQAIANLIDNALKYAPSGPVEVTVDADGVRVRDHGPGIDEADRLRVFDRFYRTVDARGAPGSGLGLAIVRQTALAHGGAATARNAPGGGALLELRLPVRAAPAGAPATTA